MVNSAEREPTRANSERGDETADSRQELMNIARNSENQEEKESVKIKIAEKAIAEYREVKKEEKRVEKKIGKLEEKRKENPSESVEKNLEKAKRKKKKITWRVSVLEKEDSLMKALDDKAENEEKKNLGEELLKREEMIRKEKEKIDEEINQERERDLSGLTEAEQEKWIEKIKKMEKRQKRFVGELGRDGFLTLLEFEKRKKEQTRKEIIEDFKAEGAEYKIMKDKKGRFTGQRLEVTENQLKEIRKEMATSTGERGKKVKKFLLSIFTSIGYLFGEFIGLLWEGVKRWAGVEKKKK